MPALVTVSDLDSMVSTLDLRDQVSLIRHHNAQVRRLAHRVLTEKIYNRTTYDALERRQSLVACAETRLAREGHRELAGLLAGERQLRARLNRNSPRPELVLRLRETETRIRTLLKES